MKAVLKLPVILGSATVLAVGALLLGARSEVVNPPMPVGAPPPVASTAPAAPEKPVVEGERPVIQIALLLDTSGSMGGLLNQARSQLWNIVNRFSKAKRGGVAPELQIALYVYGNTERGASPGEIRRVSSFTTDLDSLSERLFALQISGSSELAGQVIDEATRTLPWSKSPDAMRLVFIAGNETFDQGPVDFRKTVVAARNEGITVNTLHCGGYDEGVSLHWKLAADLADGSYLNIDHDAQVVEPPTPQDAEIARLGEALNKTYYAYGGAEGLAGQARQVAQDRQTKELSLGALVTRSTAKASRNYSNANWDLVDAVAQNKVDLASMKAEALPEPLKGLDAAGRKAWIDARAAERGAIQRRIQALSAERAAYLARLREEQKTAVSSTLDDAIGQVVAREAKRHGFTLE